MSAAVETSLNYLAPTNERPVTYTFKPPAGVAPFPRPEAHRVLVRDARSLPRPAALDVEGFARVDFASLVSDFHDDAEVRSVYYPLLLRVTGAEATRVFDHTLRSASAEHRSPGVREPVRSVHNDYTALSGIRRVSDLLPAAEAQERLEGRHAIVTVWRPLRAPVEGAPLALCDARSIAADDLVATDLVYPDRMGEVYTVRYRPEHRWYYYPSLAPGEAILIKTYDSLADGTARFSAHTAFDDPTSRPDAPPRESIEARALLFFSRAS